MGQCYQDCEETYHAGKALILSPSSKQRKAQEWHTTILCTNLLFLVATLARLERALSTMKLWYQYIHTRTILLKILLVFQLQPGMILVQRRFHVLFEVSIIQKRITMIFRKNVKKIRILKLF